MVVRRKGIELCQLLTLSSNFCVALLIGKNDQAIGVGDIELLTNQDHAERRIQPRQERRFQFSLAITIGVPQQDDAVGRGATRTRLAHQPFHHETFNAFGFARWRICLGDQNIAIGQRI